MPKSHLKQSLNKLQKELQNTQFLDTDEANLLTQINDDIEQILEDQAPVPPALSMVIDRAQHVGAQLATAHPHIELALREISAALGKMGI